MVTYLGAAILIYFAILGAMYMNQHNMIYVATTQKPQLKDSRIEGVEEITITTADGLSLRAWYKAPKNDKHPTILRFHGNGSNVMWSMNSMQSYVSQGYGVLAVEYRGYSGNPGRASEQGFYNDARAYIEWLIKNGTPESSIILYGESLGSGPAVQMAVEYPAIDTLVLQCAFSSMTEAAAFHYPYFPVALLLKDRYNNLSKIGKIKSPLILVHGTKDSIIPYRLAQKLFDAAPQPKTMITIEGGNHNDLADFKIDQKIMSSLSE